MSFLSALFSHAETPTWSLQVTDPNHELTYYDLDDKEFKPYLPRTSWRCFTGASQRRREIVLKTLRCSYSVEKTGEFTTTISCSKNTPQGEALIDLYDERKNLSFKIKLSCNQL